MINEQTFDKLYGLKLFGMGKNGDVVYYLN